MFDGTLHWNFGLAWIAFALAVALHVADEARHDFLATYNPNAIAIRRRLHIPFPPVFTFPRLARRVDRGHLRSASPFAVCTARRALDPHCGPAAGDPRRHRQRSRARRWLAVLPPLDGRHPEFTRVAGGRDVAVVELRSHVTQKLLAIRPVHCSELANDALQCSHQRPDVGG